MFMSLGVFFIRKKSLHKKSWCIRSPSFSNFSTDNEDLYLKFFPNLYNVTSSVFIYQPSKLVQCGKKYFFLSSNS